MPNTELIEKIIIAVVAAFSKDIISWIVRRVTSTVRTLGTALKPAIVAFVAKYWRVLFDVVMLIFIAVVFHSLAFPPKAADMTRSDVYFIAFFAAWQVYWLSELQKDWAAVTRTKKN